MTRRWVGSGWTLVLGSVLWSLGVAGCDTGTEPPGSGADGGEDPTFVPDGAPPEGAPDGDVADGGPGDGGGHGDGGERPPPREPTDREEDPSALHYGSRAADPDERDLATDENGEAPSDDGTFAGRRYRGDGRPAVAWNSPGGRRTRSDDTPDLDNAVGREAYDDGDLPTLVFTDGACVEPSYGGRICRFVPNHGGAPSTGSDGPGSCAPDDTSDVPDGFYRAKSLKAAFDSEESIEAYLATVRPYMGIYLPFRHPSVRLTSSYLRNSGALHGALDLARGDGTVSDTNTFPVRAVADGVVRHVYWQIAGGNVVVIEHTAPNGFRFLSAYSHLRNGRWHDQDRVREMSCDGNPQIEGLSLEARRASARRRCRLYKTFLEKHPNHPAWGDEGDYLRVDVGQPVRAGQLIGWAGTTGIGSAPRMIDENGDPKDFAVNTHLHFSMLAQSPFDENEFIYIDPYGVYGSMDSGCYDLLADTRFDRLFAPFYASFHNVPLKVLLRFRSYWTVSGGSLRTLSVHRDGALVRASGSFQWGGEPTVATSLYVTRSQLQSIATYLGGRDLVPFETTVVRRPVDDSWRFNVLWREKREGESFAYLPASSPAERDAQWEEYVVDRGWRVADAFRFDDGRQQVALYTNDRARPFWRYVGQSSDAAIDTIRERLDEDGALPVSFQIVEAMGGRQVDTILGTPGGCALIRWGMSPGQYQAFFDEMGQRGYRLAKVQGYGDSNRFAALFVVPPEAVAGSCP